MANWRESAGGVLVPSSGSRKRAAPYDAHLTGMPPAGIGASNAARTFAKAWTNTNASITGGVLAAAAAWVQMSGATSQITASTVSALDGGTGPLVFDTGGTIPYGTFISSYSGGGGNLGPIGNYHLTNKFGTAIPNVAAGNTIFIGASANHMTNVKITQDCNMHSIGAHNFTIEQGLNTDGTDRDLPVANDLRLYRQMEFVARDSINTRVSIPCTFGGKPYLDMPGGTPVYVHNDPVNYPAFEGDNVAIKDWIVHGDLKGTAFVLPVYNSTVNSTNTGMKESILYGGGNYSGKLTSDGSYWNSGTWSQSQNHYRPFGFVSRVVKDDTKVEVLLTGDSITAPDNPYIVKVLRSINVPFVNIAKGGESQRNWPQNVQGRAKAMFGNLAIICHGTNGGSQGLTGANEIAQQIRMHYAAGFDRVACITSTVVTAVRIQTAAGSIDASGIFTPGAFTTGSVGTTPISPTMTVKGTGVNQGTYVSAQIDGAVGGVGGARYQLVEEDGTPYAGAVCADATFDTWGSDLTQTSGTGHVTMNNAINAFPNQAAGGPSFILRVWEATRSPTDHSKWAPYITADGTHLGGSRATQVFDDFAIAENWTGLILGTA